MKDDNKERRLNISINNFELERKEFFQKLKYIQRNFFKNDEMTPLEGYFIDYPNNSNYYVEEHLSKLYLRKRYILDLIPLFGRYHSINDSFSGLLSVWNNEFSDYYKGAKASMDKVKISFKNIVEKNYVLNSIKKINDFKQPLEIIYENRLKTIRDKLEKIIFIGRSFTAIFLLLLPCLSVLMFFIFTMLCKKCCYLKCYLKIIIYVIWNLLALSMIISIFIGSIITLIANGCQDKSSIISYIVSPDNFNDSNPIIIKYFKTGKDILKECFVGEGNFLKIFEFDLKNIKDDLEIFKEAKKDIEKYKNIFSDLKSNHPAYNNLKSLLDTKTNFTEDTYLYYYNSTPIGNNIIQKVKLDEIIKLLNDSIGNTNNERWDKYKGDKSIRCNIQYSIVSHPNRNLLDPWTCEPLYRNWVTKLDKNNNIKNYAKIATDIISLLKYANDTNHKTGVKNYYDILNQLLKDYDKYLDTSIKTLTDFDEYASEIVNKLENIIDYYKNGIFLFDGKIFKTNLKILLNYLKNSFGKKSYTLGILLIIIGFILILSSISSSLFLIILNTNKGIEPFPISVISNDIVVHPNFNSFNPNIFGNKNKAAEKSDYGSDDNDNFGDKKMNLNKKQKTFKSPFNTNISNKSKPDDTVNNSVSESKVNFYKKRLNRSIDPYDAKYIKNKMILLKNEVKIEKLKINLIFFYENMTEENNNLYNKLKLIVEGAFFGIQNKDVLQELLLKIQKVDSSFILISTGSSFQKVSNICNRFLCIKHILIYCFDVNKYKSLYKNNDRVNLKSSSIYNINEFLFSKSSEENYDKNIKYFINYNQLFSFYEYKNYYYIYHKMLSFFFKEDYSNLQYRECYMKKMFNFIKKNTNYNESKKGELTNIIVRLKNSKNFLKDSSKFYTSENDFVYFFNRIMRNIDKSLARLSFIIGPMYYSMVRYLEKENPSLKLNKSMTLYRSITINRFDLNIYYMSFGDIICFPSFTSTSIKEGFSATQTAKNVNQIDEEDEVELLMKLHYDHKPYYSNQGMFLNKDFSVNSHEEEILLFPFTFIKANTLKSDSKKKFVLDCTIINKDCIFEFGLKGNKKIILANKVLTIK